MDDFLRRLRAHDWSRELAPEWNAPDDAPRAIAAAWRGEAMALCAMKGSLTNDHAGVWFPVLLPAMPFLEEVLARGPAPGARAVVGLLVDLAYSFEVQPVSATEDRLHERALRGALASIRRVARTIVASGHSEAARAMELVEAIDARLADDRGL